MKQAAHHYHPVTLLYTHSSGINVTPGYDKPLIPQCATLAMIPYYDKVTQELKFDLINDSWSVVSKNQKVTAYHKETQEQKEFNDKSLVTDEYTLNEPPTPYHALMDGVWVGNNEKAINAKRTEINNWRKQMENNESQIVTAIGFDWDSGPSARLRIDSTLLTAVMPPYWTDANNIDHEGMTLEDLKRVKVAINDVGFAIHDKQRTMKKEVEALTDFDDILNYRINEE